MSEVTHVTHADVVVIGAGPGGSAAATFLAQAGHDVIICEKESFPRDKVCGDGLTPRAVKALDSLGLHDEALGLPTGWQRQEGLRMYGAKVVLDFDWPELGEWPGHSVTATRALFDHTLAANAEKAGAHLWQETEIVAPVYLTTSEQRVAGVHYRKADGTEGVIRAPVVLCADGGSSRFAVQLGLHRNDRRPMGVAVRAYYRSPRSDMGMMEGFLELYRKADSASGPAAKSAAAGSAPAEGELLPGYGWIFPLDDGLINVGWGMLNSSEHFRSTNYRQTLFDWVETFPDEWEVCADTRVGKPRSAGLPMGHNRTPPVHKGVLLVGDAGGMVNPFNGEGISYAIEAGEFAAAAADRAILTRSDVALDGYAHALNDAWGGYYTLGNIFVKLIGHPTVMRVCRDYGMPRRTLMEFVFRMMAHLIDEERPSDATDRILTTLARAAPAA